MRKQFAKMFTAKMIILGEVHKNYAHISSLTLYNSQADTKFKS